MHLTKSLRGKLWTLLKVKTRIIFTWIRIRLNTPFLFRPLQFGGWRLSLGKNRILLIVVLGVVGGCKGQGSTPPKTARCDMPSNPVTLPRSQFPLRSLLTRTRRTAPLRSPTPSRRDVALSRVPPRVLLGTLNKALQLLFRALLKTQQCKVMSRSLWTPFY